MNGSSVNLSGHKQLVSIKGYNNDLVPIDYGVLKGLVLGPLLFLIYINDLHERIQQCKVHHFPDDTNLFHTSKLVKNQKKLVNCDMKHCITGWVRIKFHLMFKKLN